MRHDSFDYRRIESLEDKRSIGHAKYRHHFFVDSEAGKAIQDMGPRSFDGRRLKPKEVRATLGPGLKQESVT